MVEEEWITVREAAELSGYHPEHIRRLIRVEKIKAQKFAIVWQVSRSSLEIYLEEKKKDNSRN